MISTFELLETNMNDEFFYFRSLLNLLKIVHFYGNICFVVTPQTTIYIFGKAKMFEYYISF